MSKAAAFLAGMGTGYFNAEKQKAETARQDKKDKSDEEDRALRRQEAELRLKQLQRADADQTAIRDAAAPAKVDLGYQVTDSAGSNAFTKDADAAAVMQDMAGAKNADAETAGVTRVNEAVFNEPNKAAAAAGVYNAPEATSKRVITALSGVDPLKAMDAQHVQTVRDREKTRFTQEQEAYGKKLRDEGVFDALKAMRAGNGAGVAEAFNKSGAYKIEGEVQMVREDREIPGIGKIPSYTAKFNVKMPDGTVKAVSYNSHDLGMSLMPYEKYYDGQLKTAEVRDKGELRAAQAEASAARADASRARAAGGTGGGGGGGSSAGGVNFDPLEGFDGKQAQAAATKMVDEALMGRETPATPQERANLINQQVFALRDSWGQQNTQRFAASTVVEALNASKSDPATYAATYAKALQVTDAATLAKRGFPAPAKAASAAPAKSAPAAQSGTGAPAKAATAAPAAAPAAKTATLAEAWGVNGKDEALDTALKTTLTKAEAAATDIKKAKAELTAAANSADTASVTALAKKLQAARNKLDTLTKNMSDQQANKVRAASGY